MPTLLPVRTTRYRHYSPWLALLILAGCTLAVLTLPAYASVQRCFVDAGSLSRITPTATVATQPFAVHRVTAEFFWLDWDQPTGQLTGFGLDDGQRYTVVLPGGAPQFQRADRRPIWPNKMQPIDCPDSADAGFRP